MVIRVVNVMNYKDLTNKRVHDYYWEKDLNCATTMLKILAEIFELELSAQLLNAAIGMHGAGGYRAQCGLVEGVLMFIGIYGRENDLSREEIVVLCCDFAGEFEDEFGSLTCKELRPEGFSNDNPPHLCEDLSKDAVQFSLRYINNIY